MSGQELLTIFGGTTAIIGCVTYLGKLIIDKVADSRVEAFKTKLDKDLEVHKSTLQKELEVFKSDLEKANVEHQIKYSKLYEERGGVIRAIYRILWMLENSFMSLTETYIDNYRINNPNTNDFEAVTHWNEELKEAIDTNRIFFSESICVKIDEINTQIFNMIKLLQDSKRNIDFIIRDSQQTTVDMTMPIKKLTDLHYKIISELKIAKSNIAEQFRGLLGVNEN